MIKKAKKGRNGGFIEAILLIIVFILIAYYLKDNPTVISYWNTFTDNWERMKGGGPNDYQLAAPVVNLSSIDWNIN